jgi:hypothetical protein
MNNGWDFESIEKALTNPSPRRKYIITDDRDEFIAALERIAKSGFKVTKDNLRYLEQLDKIKEVKAGADIETVFPWIKDCDHL